jgi:signal transduction histidine kinase
MLEKFGLDVRLDVASKHQSISSALNVFLFRAIQELLFNTTKHAGVTSARVGISTEDGELIIVVSDEGQGFNLETGSSTADKKGFGLLSIKERALSIGVDVNIDSAPGKGTRVTLKAPFGLSTEELPEMGPQE